MNYLYDFIIFLLHPPNPQLICTYYVCQVGTLKEKEDDNEERCFTLGFRITTGFYIRSVPEGRLGSQNDEKEFYHGWIIFLIFVCNAHVSLLVFSIYAMLPSTGSVLGTYFICHTRCYPYFADKKLFISLYCR